MDHSLSLISIGIVAFASTNVDDLVMLIALFIDRSYRPSHIVIGQFAGMLGLIALSLAGSLLALIVPTAYIGFVGCVPIAIGLCRFWRGRGTTEPDRPVRGTSSVAAATLVTLANGGDNLSLYIPLFSIHRGGETLGLVAIFLVLTGLWCVAGFALARPRFLGWEIAKWGEAILPYVMIAIGIYIFVKTDVLTVFEG